jgi:hypothetical protein
MLKRETLRGNDGGTDITINSFDQSAKAQHLSLLVNHWLNSNNLHDLMMGANSITNREALLMKKTHLDLYEIHLGEIPTFFKADEAQQIKKLSLADFEVPSQPLTEFDTLRSMRIPLQKINASLCSCAKTLGKPAILLSFLGPSYNTLGHLLIAEFIHYFKNFNCVHRYLAIEKLSKRLDLFKDLAKEIPQFLKYKAEIDTLIRAMAAAFEECKEKRVYIDDNCKAIKNVTKIVWDKIEIFLVKSDANKESEFIESFRKQITSTLSLLMRAVNRLSELQINRSTSNLLLLVTSEQLRQDHCVLIKEIELNATHLCGQIKLFSECAYSSKEIHSTVVELTQLLKSGITSATAPIRGVVGTEEGRLAELNNLAAIHNWPKDQAFLHLAQNPLDDTAQIQLEHTIRQRQSKKLPSEKPAPLAKSQFDTFSNFKDF